jgi:1-aminocyclopropane-1-carboxylate synthase 1/2/6
MISQRSARLIGNTPPLVLAHFKCEESPFHPATNPSGYINLGTAENHLLWEKLRPIIDNGSSLPEKSIHYDYPYGSRALREALARYLESSYSHRPLDAENIVVSSGASSIIDFLAYTFCEAGDGVLIPAPYYSGFDADLQLRADVKPVPIHLNSKTNFSLTIEDVRRAWEDSKAQGLVIKAILVSNPNNPLGTCYSEKLVRELAEFTSANGIHCIFDEIYGKSLLGQSKHFSALCLSAESATELAAKWENVHFVSGFAKDFSLSGFKTGYLYSNNQQVVAAVRQLAYLSPVSTYTQWKLTQFFSDPNQLRELLDYNQTALTQASAMVSTEFSALGIPHVPPQGGQFIFLNLGKHLKDLSFESERLLWTRLFEKFQISIIPGEVFHCSEPGWFRLCFAHKPEVLREGLRRLKAALTN